MPILTRLRPLVAILFLFASLSSASSASNSTRCGINNLEACINTNRLVWDKAFQEALAEFIGDRPAGWLYEDGTMLGQVRAVLGGPPDRPVHFGNNLIRFSACRHHSCDEKGAVVLTTDGEIIAVGVLHFDISRTRSGHPMLTVLTRARNGRFQDAADHLFAWYEKVTTDYNKRQKERYELPETSEKLRRISDPEIVVLTNLRNSQP